MSTKKTKLSNHQSKAGVVRQPSSYHRLDALLHTMRCIAQYEDALCGLSHELKEAGAPSPELLDELREILEKIPAHDYLMDLESVRAILAVPSSPKRSSSKKSATPAKTGKNSRAAKKSSRSGRKPSK